MSSSINVRGLETVLYEKKGSTAYVMLNRPTVLNALNRAAIADLRSALEDARDDASITGVILSGSGDKAFIAGADIGELSGVSAVEAEVSTRRGQELMDLIEGLGKPVVAAINGVALGGGCETAMACTIRVASKYAKFGQPEVKLGLIPGYGGTQRLARLVGKGIALQLILSGDMIPAEEAYRIGLVNEVVEPDALLTRCEEILAKICANGPLAVRYSIEAVNRGLDGSLQEGLALESKLFALCAATEDKKEGTSAFLEKRRPKFEGR
ncbi:MAG: enoyl-CoA hydratase/isomerase family protein [Candidatus Eremiobacteraeota bacterium]|nr:enoyl-CoA hydratase/isomerase family protein [Candidatus Eremiobacteraeota bacterium]